MPRSNKKKGGAKSPSSALPFLEPPPSTMYSSPRLNILPDKAISNVLSQEKEVMIARSVRMAKKHGINLRYGRSNPGTGDCAFEAVIYNINDRSDFEETLSINVN